MFLIFSMMSKVKKRITKANFGKKNLLNIIKFQNMIIAILIMAIGGTQWKKKGKE